MGKEIVRVLRILEYVGERDWVEETLKKGGVPKWDGKLPQVSSGATPFINLTK